VIYFFNHVALIFCITSSSRQINSDSQERQRRQGAVNFACRVVLGLILEEFAIGVSDFDQFLTIQRYLHIVYTNYSIED